MIYILPHNEEKAKGRKRKSGGVIPKEREV
jgi:hypothetical protein